MIEILIMLVAVLLAKHPKRRRMGRYIKGHVDEELQLTTLAAGAVTTTAFDDSVNERTLLSSLVAKWSLSNFTLGQDIGPIQVGVAHSDYTGTEITEYLDNTGSWDEGNKISQEIGRRKIRSVGVFQMPATGADAVLNDGKAIKTKLNWILNQGQTLDLWARNIGTAAVATTVPSLNVNGHVNLFPK